MITDSAEKSAPSGLQNLDASLLLQLVESIPEPLFVKDEQHRWVHVNEAFCGFVGYRREELLGRSDYDFFPKEQADVFWQKDRMVFESGSANVNVEQLTSACGRVRVISTRKSILTDGTGRRFLVGMIRDISVWTRREKYQEQVTRILQQLVLGTAQEEILMLVARVAEEEFPGAIATIMLLDAAKKKLFQAVPSRLPEDFSRAIDGTPARRGMGSCGEAAYSRRRVVVDSLTTHPGWQRLNAVIRQHDLNSCWSEPVFSFSGRVEGTFALYFSASILPDSFDVEILETLSQLISVTLEHQRVQRETQHLRVLLSDMINAMPSLLIAVDRRGRVMQWNAEAEKMTGLSADEARGRELGSVLSLSADQLESIYQAIDERQSLSWSRIDHRWAGADHWLDLTLYPVSGQSKVGSVIRLDDVTEQVRVEQLMVQTEKIHSLGGLAAGMAHEINNPLAAILQNIQVMKNRLRKGLKKNEEIAAGCGGSIDLIERYMQERDIFNLMSMVLEDGERASGIVNNMLDFCRTGDARIRLANVAELMDKTVALLDNDYNQNQRYDFRKVVISRDYQQDLPEVACEGTNLQQVFFNLLKNAAQAMSMAEVERPEIVIRMRSRESWLEIEIEDNGPGMLPEVQRRIFEPFYTTKPVGTGTGLGLSVAYFLITDVHRGRMSVRSQSGKGAIFTIALPRDRHDERGAG